MWYGEHRHHRCIQRASSPQKALSRFPLTDHHPLTGLCSHGVGRCKERTVRLLYLYKMQPVQFIQPSVAFQTFGYVT